MNDLSPIEPYVAAETDSEEFRPATRWGFRPGWLLLVLSLVPLFAVLFWWLGSRFFDSQLGFFEYQQFLCILAAVVAGGYQLYFWVQRNNSGRRGYCLHLKIDDWIPFRPGWIWPYSFLYYLMIGVTVMSIQDLGQGMHFIYGGLMLLISGCSIFYFFPTYVPDSYRQFEVNSLSTRYLAFVQTMDNNRNALPSMHCALATYVALIVMQLPYIGAGFAFGYIVIIVISCLLVKQHAILDTFAGVVHGALIFKFNEELVLFLA